MERKKFTEKEKKEKTREAEILNEIAIVAGAINRHKHKKGKLKIRCYRSKNLYNF